MNESYKPFMSRNTEYVPTSCLELEKLMSSPVKQDKVILLDNYLGLDNRGKSAYNYYKKKFIIKKKSTLNMHKHSNLTDFKISLNFKK
jgi:hypothetical protein